MLGGILKILESIYEFFVLLEDGFLQLAELLDSEYIIGTFTSLLSWLPYELLSLVVACVGVAIIFKILGR